MPNDPQIGVALERKVFKVLRRRADWATVGKPYVGPESGAPTAKSSMLRIAAIGDNAVDGENYRWIVWYPKRRQPPPRYPLPADRRRSARSR